MPLLWRDAGMAQSLSGSVGIVSYFNGVGAKIGLALARGNRVKCTFSSLSPRRYFHTRYGDSDAVHSRSATTIDRRKPAKIV